MSDEQQELRCQNCDTLIERQHVKGPVPSYCEECRVLQRRATNRNAQRRLREKRS